MDWSRYKQLCDSPWVFTRWMLEQTHELVSRAGGDCQPLEKALQGQALAKPDGHKGGEPTDMIELNLTVQQTSVILTSIRRADAAGAFTRATRQRGLGGFVEAWQEYDNYLRLERNRDAAAGD